MTGYELATLLCTAAIGIGVPAVGALIGIVWKLNGRVATLEADAKLHTETREAIVDLRGEIHALGLAIRSLEARLSDRHD